MRILRALSFLFFKLKSVAQNDDLSDLQEAWNIWTSNTQKPRSDLLNGALNLYSEGSLIKKQIESSYDEEWSLLWTLLILRAAIWSQIAWDQPYLWEAYSAFRARQDHSSPEIMNENEVLLLTYLIRYQSLPGQYSRSTGDDIFICRAYEVCRTFNKHGSKINAKELLTALGILAHAQEFRSRMPSDTAQESLLKTEDAYLPNDPKNLTNFNNFWERIYQLEDDNEPKCEQSAIWSYGRWLTQEIGGEKKLNNFKGVVKGVVNNIKVKNVVAYTFGRDYLSSENHRKSLINGIKQVVNTAKLSQESFFNSLFSYHTVSVPDVIDLQKQESAIIIRLREEITAQYMVFSELQDETLSQKENKSNSAWELFKSLFELAERNQALNFIHWQSKKANNYCPTYLIGRFLEVCFRLYPESSIQLPVEIDGHRVPSIHLPKLPNNIVNNDERLVKIIGRYVVAYAQNKMMATGTNTLKMGLRNLDDYPSNGISMMATGTNTLKMGLRNLDDYPSNGSWRSVIRREFDENHTIRLLGDYVENYLRIDNHVLVDYKLLTGFTDTKVTFSNLNEDLKVLIKALEKEQNITNKKSTLLLGIDIGGSFIKLIWYELLHEDNKVILKPWNKMHLESDPEPVRMVTPLGKDNFGRDQQYQGASPFCERILREIHSQMARLGHTLEDLEAIGISWPGPIHNGQIRGWSGIIKHFVQQNGEPIRDTSFQALLELDIAGKMVELIKERTGGKDRGKDIPTIIINDGESHAIGISFQILLAASNNKNPLSHSCQAIVKAGTGTAGALIKDGQLVSGLMEFGKILINLAYIPDGGYPQGLANRYCSARTLPNEMIEIVEQKLRKSHLKELQPDLTSLEVGLLAELSSVGEDTDLQGKLIRLREICGMIALASSLPDQVDLTELEKLLKDEGWKVRSRSRQFIERYLCAAGNHAFEQLKNLVKNFGMIRLESILDLDPQAVNGLMQFIEDSQYSVDFTTAKDKLDTLAKFAKESVASLGNYIGDLAALLYSEHGISHIIVSGGVLSGYTGIYARECASKRLEQYSEFRKLGGNVITLEGDPQSSIKIDPGSAGAAIRAALELLAIKRRKGLEEIRGMVQELKITEQIALVRKDRKDCVEKEELIKYCLDVKQVYEYFNKNADDLGIICASSQVDNDSNCRYTYTRWTTQTGL